MVLLGLAGLLLPAGTATAGTRKKQRRRQRKRRQKDRLSTRATLVVRDYTNASWDGVIPQVVADFNAVMPKKAPRLIYERRSHICGEDIEVCSTLPPGDFLGLATAGEPGESLLDLQADPQALSDAGKRGLACHEMMHALTGIRDCYGCRIDSCVHGYRATPGSFDIKKLARVWGQKPKRRHRR